MLENDILCRTVIYPRILKNGQFDFETLLRFSGGGDSIRSLSLASFFLCKNEDGVHKYGKRVAEVGNCRQAINGDLNSKSRLHYLGFYNMRYGQVSELISSNLFVEVYWKGEKGFDEHFQLDLIPHIANIARRVNQAIAQQQTSRKSKHPPNPEKRIEKEIDREVRVIRARLAQLVFGPVRAPVGLNDPRLELQEEFLPRQPE